MSTSFHNHAATILAVFLLTASPAQAARNPEWAETVSQAHNLYRVAPGFYRSAKIDAADTAMLQSMGIKTVVNLRAFHADDALLRGIGIAAVRIPINTWDITDDKVVAALRAIHVSESKGPVLLHCQHGADRTGLISAMYRIVYQNWDKEKALDELMHGGYGYHAMWRNIPRYIRAADIDSLRRRLEAQPEGQTVNTEKQ